MVRINLMLLPSPHQKVRLYSRMIQFSLHERKIENRTTWMRERKADPLKVDCDIVENWKFGCGKKTTTSVPHRVTVYLHRAAPTELC